MIFTSETIIPQLKDLLNLYPNLAIVEQSENQVLLHGSILVYREYNGFILRKSYLMTIVIPLNTDDLPYVKDSNHQISKDYIHYYQDGQLCLATDTQMRLRFVDGFILIEWMAEFVELYFLSYEYYQRYLCFPFGDCAHGSVGILQTYQDVLHTNSASESYKLMCYMKEQLYRGHLPCPCGSSLSTRNCHGKYMIDFYKNSKKRTILVNDLILIKKELTEYERYRKKAK